MDTRVSADVFHVPVAGLMGAEHPYHLLALKEDSEDTWAGGGGWVVGGVGGWGGGGGWVGVEVENGGGKGGEDRCGWDKAAKEAKVSKLCRL